MNLCAHGVTDRPCLRRVFMKEAGRRYRLYRRKSRGWPCLANELFLSDAQTMGSHCVFGESMIWKLSTWSKLEPACFIHDKIASEIWWLCHFCVCSLPWVGWVMGTSWGLFLFSAYLRIVGQEWFRPFINAPPPWPYWEDEITASFNYTVCET